MGEYQYYSSAVIFGTELRNDASSSKPFMAFQVTVRRGQDQWVVLRSHSLFATLHAKLKERFSYAVKRHSLHMPKGKKLRSTPSPVVISRVHRKLQRYLIGVFAEPQLRTSTELHQFLSVGKQPLNEYMPILQPVVDTICHLGEPGEAPDPKSATRDEVLAYAMATGMQCMAEGGLIGLDVRHSGYLSVYHKGRWRDRFFQLRGTNALFKFASPKDSTPTELLSLGGCKISLMRAGEEKAGDHCFKLVWTNQREGKASKNITLTLSARTEEELSGWVSHLNNFAFARADALLRKRIPHIPILTGEADQEDPEEEEEAEEDRQACGEGKGKECEGDREERRPKPRSAEHPQTLHRSTDQREVEAVHRALKRSGSENIGKLRRGSALSKAASGAKDLSTNDGTTKHRRSASMFDDRLIVQGDREGGCSGVRSRDPPKKNEGKNERDPNREEEPGKKESEEEKRPKAEETEERMREGTGRWRSGTFRKESTSIKGPARGSKRSIGSFIQNRPIFSSLQSLPIHSFKCADESVRTRSISAVPVRVKKPTQENESIAFINLLLDGLAEDDETQVDLDVLQAEVKMFLSPSFHDGLEPLCGHTHQFSFLAVNSIQDEQAKSKVVEALLETLPQANRSAILRLLAFLDRTAVRLGKARMLERERAATELKLRRDAEERQRAEQAKARTARERIDRERRKDMYRVLKRRQTTDDRRAVSRQPTLDHIFSTTTTTATITDGQTRSSSDNMSLHAAYSSPSTSFSSLTSSLSSTCSCVSTFSTASTEEGSPLASPLLPRCGTAADGTGCVCYSAMIEREIAEERELVYRKAEEMKRKVDDMSRMLSDMSATSGSKHRIAVAARNEEEREDDQQRKDERERMDEDEEVNDKKDTKEEKEKRTEREEEEKRTIGQFRERLAGMFGRVIMACDLGDRMIGVDNNSHHQALVPVSVFLIERWAEWQQRRPDEEKKKERMDENNQVRVAEGQEKRIEERRARKMAMVEVARQKKEARIEELRQLRHRNDEIDCKAYEDRRSQAAA